MGTYSSCYFSAIYGPKTFSFGLSTKIWNLFATGIELDRCLHGAQRETKFLKRPRVERERPAARRHCLETELEHLRRVGREC